MPDLKEILASLVQFLTKDDEDADLDPKVVKERIKEIANALRSRENPALNPVAQRLVSHGTGIGKGEAGTKVAELESEVERLTGELETAQQAVEDAKGEPDERYKQLERKYGTLETQLKEASAALVEERTGRVEDRTELYVQKVVDKLSGRVEPDYLDEVIRPRVRKQIRVKPDKSVTLLPPGDEVPYDAETPEAAIPQLADDIYAGVKPQYRISKSEPGGGGGGGGGKLVTTPEDNQKKLRGTGAY